MNITLFDIKERSAFNSKNHYKMPYNTYDTKRLHLRPTTLADAPFIVELLNTPKWLQNIGDRNIKTVEAAETYIQEKMILQLERLGFSNYTVMRKSDGAKMGSCGLYDREGLSGVDIGFAFLPQFEKQGYAFEAAQVVMNAAIHDFNLTEVKGITAKENIASQKLLKKIGLSFNKMITLPGDEEEIMLFTYFKK